MINRGTLEEWIPLSKARGLAYAYFGDPDTFPEKDFRLRKRGINKDMQEEFYPLQLLAEHTPSAKSIRLLTASQPGPDGAILLADGSEFTVQITSSRERGDAYKARKEQLKHGSSSSKSRATKERIQERMQRILVALMEKEENYHVGTDMLLIVEESISWGSELDPGLPHALTGAIARLPKSNYSATFIAYGRDVRKLR